MSKNEKNNNGQKPVTYSQLKLLGVGSFGKAYLVQCNNDESLAVIKTMVIEDMDESEKKEAVLEARILEKLDHPNIIKFREVFMARKPTFTLNIVMDFADGGDLHTRIKEQNGIYFSETQIIDWFTQICLAIKHIHDKKILHRDLKSQNVFLTKNGLVKLGDFGIAKCLNYTLEKAKTVVGTAYYLSPEIVENRPYSFKSDIWSLGVLLYEMTCLKMPFDASSFPMLYNKIIRGAYIPVSSIYSKELRSLIGLMLNVDSEKRPSINDILRMPYLKTRIRNFLSEMEYNNEFSSTILKKYQIKDAKPKSSNGSNVLSSLNQLSLNKDYEIENMSKAKDNNANNKPSIEGKNKENKFRNNLNLENLKDENKQELINIPSNNPVKKTSNSKDENKNAIGSSNYLINFKRKENERKDIIDISDFIKNKKNDKKNTEMMEQQNNNFGGNNDITKDFNGFKNNLLTSLNVNGNKDNINYQNINGYQLNKGAYVKNYLKEKKNKREKNEKTTDLQEFMEKKKREKSMPNGQEGIIWMKEMEDILNLNFDSNINSEKEARISSNNPKENNSKSNLNSNFQQYKANRITSNNFVYQKAKKYDNTNCEQYKTEYSNYSDMKDKEDYLNVHKMCINLDNIEKEVEIEDFEINQEEIKISDINPITRDFNVISEDEYASTIQSHHINNIYIKNYNKNSCNTGVEGVKNDSDNCLIESMRIELETTLGLDLFKTVYKIINDNTDPNQYAYDRILIKGKIRKELLNKFSNSDIDKAIDKIGEIYSIILKEREMMFR